MIKSSTCGKKLFSTKPNKPYCCRGLLYLTENNVRHKRFCMLNSAQESHLLSQQS